MPYLVALILSVTAPQSTTAQDFGPVIDGAWSPSQIAEKKVSYLFEKMEKGKYNQVTFPKYIGWNEIPTFLRWAEKKTVLHNFPINPASSQTQKDCTEGMVALWLVEGIRVGGKFPSNNPIGLGPYLGTPKEHAHIGSEALHDTLTRAYARWWNEVKELPRAKAAATDPLARTGLSWF